MKELNHSRADSSIHSESEITPTDRQVQIEEDVNSHLRIGPFSVWALGITIVIGGQYFSWNAGLQAGFGTEFISVFLTGTAYICLCLCNAELTSSLPFAGGAYGLARVTIGLYPGFIIGCFESMEYILYVASSTVLLARMIRDVTGSSEFMVPVFCLISYVVACSILIVGGRFFWWISTFGGILSLLILVIFCLGSLPNINLSSNGPSANTTGSHDVSPQWFIGGMDGFMSVLPLAGWFFVGIESLNLCASVVNKPKSTIPIGSISCVLTIFFMAIFVLCVTSALPNSTDVPTSDSLAPLSIGFSIMMNTSINRAIIFSIPATFATAYGFIFAFSRVLLAMARSGLMPPLLKATYGRYRTPHVAILAGSTVGYAMCLIVYFMPSVGDALYSLCILSAYLAYVSQFIGYIIFKRKYDQRSRQFSSPLGIFGAIYGALVFALAAIAVLLYQKDGYINLIVTLILVGCYTFYYFAYSQSRQTFSKEEKIFYPIHIVKFNQRNRETNRKGRHVYNSQNSISKNGPADQTPASVMQSVMSKSKLSIERNSKVSPLNSFSRAQSTSEERSSLGTLSKNKRNNLSEADGDDTSIPTLIPIPSPRPVVLPLGVIVSKNVLDVMSMSSEELPKNSFNFQYQGKE